MEAFERPDDWPVQRSANEALTNMRSNNASGSADSQGFRNPTGTTSGSLVRTGTKQGAASRVLPKTLDGTELRERDHCEGVILKGWDTFVEVGSALATIRDKRLYRDCFGTFEEYCRQRWEFSRTHAYRMIEAAAVAAVLSPIGVKLHSESQVHPLAGLAPRSIPAAWKRAVEIAGKGEVTAKVVRRAAEEFRHDFKHVEEIARLHRTGLRQSSLQAAFDLIRQVEEAVRAKDDNAALTALSSLHKCLSDFGQHG
jgi:hypothetical protein